MDEWILAAQRRHVTSMSAAARLTAVRLLRRGSLPSPANASIVLLVTTPFVVLLFVLAGLDVAGNASLWENGHWTLTAVVAFVLAALGTRSADGVERQLRAIGTIALGVFLGGQILADAQIAVGLYPVPAPSDFLYLGAAVPFLWGLAVAVRNGASRRHVRTFALDTAVVVATIVAIVFFAFAPLAVETVLGLGLVLLLYPISYLGLAGAMIVASLLVRSPPVPRGLYLCATGMGLMGFSWVVYLVQTAAGQPSTGSISSMVGSVGTLLVGLGVGGWRLHSASSARIDQNADRALAFLPVLAIAIATAILALAQPAAGGLTLISTGAVVAIIVSIIRQTLLLADQTRFLVREREASEGERTLREETQQALAAREVSEDRYRTLVDVFNELGERTTFAVDEVEMFAAAAAALRRLVPSRSGDILVVNPSADRLTVALAWGPGSRSEASVVDVESPTRCLGIRRGAVHVVTEAGDQWAQICPAFQANDGSTLCVPMLAVGDLVGVIHLARAEPYGFGPDDQRQAARVAEQVALAVSNARLIRKMESLALTDALTGLHNGRFFDAFLDRELALAGRDGTAIGLIAVDLDHFKEFNDTHGHPAGDEALRTFALACRETLREADTVARLGGEEFAVAIRGADLAETAAVAEKLRLAVERTTIEVGPHHSARMTASFGVVNTSVHGSDRMQLLRAADRALYDAKRQGRNAVVVAGTPGRPRKLGDQLEPMAR